MDEPRLPVLKDFEADTAPPEPPDPWWKRYCLYVFLIVVMPFVFAAFIYCWDIIYYSKHHFNETADQIGFILKADIDLALGAGLVCGICLCVYLEINEFQKRRLSNNT